MIGDLPLPRGADNFDIYGELAYVSSLTSGLHVVSLADPTAPALIGTVYPALTNSVAVSPSVVYGSGPAGLYAVPHDCTVSPTSSPLGGGPRVSALGVAPNPFGPSTSISFSLTRPGGVRLSVYDVAGRRIAGLLDGPLGEGDHRVRWDGRGRDGATPAGVYFLRLETDGESSTRKVLRIR